MAGLGRRDRGRRGREMHHPRHDPRPHHHGHPGGAVGAPTDLAKYPFIWGAQEQFVPIAAINFVSGQKAPTIRIPKNGFLGEILFRFKGAINGLTGGAAGTIPNVLQIIQSYVLSYNGGFQYRSLSGEAVYVMDLIRNAGPDATQGGPSWRNYSPTGAAGQGIGWIMRDFVFLGMTRSIQ